MVVSLVAMNTFYVRTLRGIKSFHSCLFFHGGNLLDSEGVDRVRGHVTHSNRQTRIHKAGKKNYERKEKSQTDRHTETQTDRKTEIQTVIIKSRDTQMDLCT